jgi:hypothetical protein
MSAAIAAASAPGRIRLGALLVHPVQALDRTEGDSATCDLYSLAAFGRGQAEAVQRAQLAKSAQRLQAGDVLVSRAVSQPRRAWAVTAVEGRVAVASNEWLVLRPGDHELDPAYLRQLLVSNEFHLRFTQALGAARYANPTSARLCALELPVPPRLQQQDIARVLDSADALRARRRRAMTALEELATVLPVQDSAGPRSAVERIETAMNASRRQLEALLSVLRDAAFRGELLLRTGECLE